jgi:CHAT domain-containing protein
MDYAVSSYTPTITSLTDRVMDSRPISPNVSGLFLTCQPKAPGAGQIPGTVEEIEGVYAKAAQAGGRVLKLVGDEVTVGECLKHLEEFTSVHFACHASQNAADPLHSKFLFHKGSLDLGTIIQRNLKNADLAFLSACQTSTGDAQLSNESVHLAAGMLAAGYRRVVATMWSIEDRHAIDVANDFYDYLFSHSKAEAEGGRRRQCGLDGTISAFALHEAILRLRARLDNSSASLLSWVPYVHFGW